VRIRWAMLTLLAVTLFDTGSTFARPQPGDIGVFANPEGTVSRIVAPPYETFEIFVLAWSPPGGMAEFEFRAEFGDPAPIIVVAELGQPKPEEWYNLTTAPDYIIVMASCLAPSGGWVQLLRFECIYLIAEPPSDVTVCVRGTSAHSRFDPPVAGYQQCDDSLAPFTFAQNGGVYPRGCGVINATSPTEYPIATKRTSWSRLRSRF